MRKSGTYLTRKLLLSNSETMGHSGHPAKGPEVFLTNARVKNLKVIKPT